MVHPLRRGVLRFLREITFLPPLRGRFFPSYPYMYTPAQLCFLCGCIERTKAVPGAIVEIGCARGNTTIFLNRHLDTLDAEKRYVCIDTFAGFTPSDVAYEVGRRGKRRDQLAGFQVNVKRWFDGTMALNDVRRVESFEADVNTFDFGPIGPISFCLVDVDLYQPVLSALNKVLPLLSPGGLIVVDDCEPDNRYDSALQAYREFVQARALPGTILHGKLGFIQPSHTVPPAPEF